VYLTFWSGSPREAFSKTCPCDAFSLCPIRIITQETSAIRWFIIFIRCSYVRGSTFRLEHPHIVKMYECFEERQSLWMVCQPQWMKVPLLVTTLWAEHGFFGPETMVNFRREPFKIGIELVYNIYIMKLFNDLVLWSMFLPADLGCWSPMDFLSLRGLVNLQPWRLELCRGGELYEYVAALVGLLRVAVHRGVFFWTVKNWMPRTGIIVICSISLFAFYLAKRHWAF